MRKFYILLIVTTLTNICFAQINKKKKVDDIINDTTLFYGISDECDSWDEATGNSMTELFDNIAKNCNPQAIHIPGNGDKQLENIVRTFKERIKEKAEVRAVVEDDVKEKYQYITYLKRSDFRDMCNERRDDIQRYISKGVKMENDDCFEDALKSYYWALMLTYAHPQGKKLHFPVNGETADYEWLIERINGNDGILKSFNFIVPKENGIEYNDDGMMVKLRVTNTAGKDVANLRCECYDGGKFIPNTVRDGKLMVPIKDKDVMNFKIKVNYDFIDDAKKMDASVSNAIELIKVPRFSNNIYTVDLGKTIRMKEEPTNPDWKPIEANRAVDEVDKDIYLARMELIEKALRARDIDMARECFSVEGFNILDTLSRYGKMTVIGKPDFKFLKYKDEVICRSITMQFEFKNTPGFSQDVVFRFDTINKVVTSLAFRLFETAEKDIISKGKWSDESKLALVNFLEDYQTAYALKRRGYVQSIYSDDALIIVGRMVKKTEIPDRLTLKLTDYEVEMNTYNKKTYMENLSKCFDNNEYIWLRFTETDFTKVNGIDDVYGVRVRQEWFSSSYGDVGYLFIIVDLCGAQPLIHVRAWQPDKVDLDKLIGTGDVRIN